MTTHCPILRRLVQHLSSSSSGFFDDELGLEDLRQGAAGASPDHSLVALRGFMVIEFMLEFAKRTYDDDYKTPLSPDLPLKLKIRSWGGLTDLREELKLLSDEVTMELSEALLEGHSIDENSSVIIIRGSSPDASEDNATRTRRLTAAKRIQDMSLILTASINTFRPYLKNEDAAVATLGDDATQLLHRVYGMYPVDHLAEFIRKLIEVRL